MSMLEVISLRSAGTIETGKAVEVLEQFKRPQEARGVLCMRVYNNALFENDLSIHIYWDSNMTHRGKSPLGLQIVQLFKRFGLVNHNVWLERNEMGNESHRNI
jgi:hypothetical protein